MRMRCPALSHFAGRLVLRNKCPPPLSRSQNISKTIKNSYHDLANICASLQSMILNHYLVGGFNPFEKYSSNWKSSPSRGHHLAIYHHLLAPFKMVPFWGFMQFGAIQLHGLLGWPFIGVSTIKFILGNGWVAPPVYVGVSKNRGTPKWMVYNGKPYLGVPLFFGNIHVEFCLSEAETVFFDILLIFFLFFRIVALSVQHTISLFPTVHPSFCKLLVDSKTLCSQLPLASFSHKQFHIESTIRPWIQKVNEAMTTRSAHDGIHHNLRKIMVTSQKSRNHWNSNSFPFFFNNKMMESKIMIAFPQDNFSCSKMNRSRHNPNHHIWQEKNPQQCLHMDGFHNCLFQQDLNFSLQILQLFTGAVLEEVQVLLHVVHG